MRSGILDSNEPAEVGRSNSLTEIHESSVELLWEGWWDSECSCLVVSSPKFAVVSVPKGPSTS